MREERGRTKKRGDMHMEANPAYYWCSIHQHNKTETIVTYFNNSAVVITRCKYCKRELRRKTYQAK